MNALSRLRLAAEVAVRCGDSGRTFRLGAIGIRHDGVLVAAYNGSPRANQVPMGHAEARLSRKLDKGCVVYVARATAAGGLALARPCTSCMTFLRARKVKRIYYTICENEFGIIDL